MSEGFDAFLAGLTTVEGRRERLFMGDRPRHVLMAQQFSRADLEALCDTATAIRRLDRHRDGMPFLRGLMAGHRVMNLFAQPSTRTCESFVAAAEKLGATARVVSDLSTSSFAKGETVEDSVRTLSSFYDTLVTRHQDDQFAARAAWALSRSGRPIPVVSAGSGKAEHPTQALLDIYTLRYSFAGRGGVNGKRLLLVGDIGRNRAARSLALLLLQLGVGAVDVACFPGHEPEQAFKQAFTDAGVPLTFYATLRDAIDAVGPLVDALYMTRLQQEWDTSGAALGTSADFVLDPSFKSQLREDCVLMHPLPRVNELPDDWETHPGFVVWRQVRNGMWMRAALLATIHGADGEIRARGQRLGVI